MAENENKIKKGVRGEFDYEEGRRLPRSLCEALEERFRAKVLSPEAPAESVERL